MKIVSLCVWVHLMVSVVSVVSVTEAWAERSDHELLVEVQAERRALGARGEGVDRLFEQVSVLIWPQIDLRPLFDDQLEGKALSEPSSVVEGGASPESGLLEVLRSYPNLTLSSPQEVLRATRSKRAYERTLTLARGFARRGVQAYREVELAQARAQLESALELFEQAQQPSLDPREVAQLHVTLGLIALERGEALAATLAFREALLLNPKLRLRRAFDGERAAQRFEQARQQLLSLPLEELTRLVERAHYPLRSQQRRHQLTRLRTPRGLSVTLSVWRGEHLDAQRDEAVGAPELSAPEISRLASRLWACLPFSRPQRRPEATPLNLDAQVSAMGFVQSPVDVVLFRGVELSAALTLFKPVELLLSGGWHTSGRDVREDLRRDVQTYALQLGPLWRFGRGGRSMSASLALTLGVRHFSEVIVTREVGCKYFDLSADLPPQLCQPQRDITRFDESWRVTSRLLLGVSVPLRGDLALIVNLSASSEVYELSEGPFKRPVSLSVGLGYGFHLGSR